MSTTDRVRLGFVGAGRHATQSLYPNLAFIPGVELGAVCDLDAAKAAEAAQRFGARAHFTDLDAMLDAERLDGVCICGGTQMHHDVALRVLERGLPVFVEKPPAGDLAGARELAETARRHRTFGVVAFMKRFAPAFRIAREAMQSPNFGPLTTLSVVHGCGPYTDLRQMLLVNGIHMLDLACFLAGEVANLSAFAVAPSAPTRAVVVNLQFVAGAVGSVNINAGHEWNNCIETVYASGHNAALTVDSYHRVELISPQSRFVTGAELESGSWTSAHQVSANLAGWWPSGHYTRGYWGELDHFVKACRGAVLPSPSLADGVKALRWIEAIMLSAGRGGEVVPLERI